MPSRIALPWGSGFEEMKHLVGRDMSQSAGNRCPIVSGGLAMGICNNCCGALARLLLLEQGYANQLETFTG